MRHARRGSAGLQPGDPGPGALPALLHPGEPLDRAILQLTAQAGPPACGTDGVTYRNACLLEQAACLTQPGLGLHHPGCCGSPAHCPAFCPTAGEQRYCGADGVSYPSMCHVLAAACRGAGPGLVRRGDCPAPARPHILRRGREPDTPITGKYYIVQSLPISLTKWQLCFRELFSSVGKFCEWY